MVTVALLNPNADNLPAWSSRLKQALALSGLTACVFNSLGADVHLLMGLDAAAAATACAADAEWRAQLAVRGVAFHVLYGTPEQQLAQATTCVVRQVQPMAASADVEPPNVTPEPPRRWVWACDKCSDPVCEHALLTGLLAQRTLGAAGTL